MYLNDKTVLESLKNVLSVIAKKCRIYIPETIGVSKRLTLNKFFSDDLDSEYSVIYRTQEEYSKLFMLFCENGFTLTNQGSLMIDTTNNNETERVYFIYSRT